ncbi:MAG: T9SS type A sorting domain-containing protein, partial [Bacteroides sp.]|nr:T9SS type A sorting domain-containing protein [Bacteroides sp.]
GDTTGASISADTLILVMDSEKNISAEYSLLSGIVQANKTLDFTVSPNPSHGIFHIDMITTGLSFYSVYSTNGTAIINGKADGPFDIDLSAFKKGLFLLKIKTDQAFNFKKLILN